MTTVERIDLDGIGFDCGLNAVDIGGEFYVVLHTDIVLALTRVVEAALAYESWVTSDDDISDEALDIDAEFMDALKPFRQVSS